VFVIAAFVALFSRVWFLQVLASDDFRALAKENRVRIVQSEPERGRILDRNGFVLVDNRYTPSVTVDREILETPVKKRAVFRRLSELLKVKERELNRRLQDVTVSPYKPVAVANDVPIRVVNFIDQNPEDFIGVDIETRPIRVYPQGKWAAQILGYVGEVTDVQLKEDYFKDARPRYRAGDIVGRSGLERSYDRQLRGTPSLERLVVNSAGKRVGGESDVIQEEEPGKDLVTTLDVRIQKLAEEALASGIEANRGAGYRATDGAAIVLDPNTGGVVAMASFPTFDPNILSDGLQTKEYDKLGARTKEVPEDDALINRTIGVAYSPGSTFKVATAQAALGLGVASTSTYLPCPGSVTFGEGTGATTFPNWTSVDFGSMGFSKSLEVSCDTFYYQLGWDMEERWGAGNGDGSERFQDFLRLLGFDDPTGVDLPGEIGGTVPDEKWLGELCEALGDSSDTCSQWLPGYSVNMAIGQGDLIATPIQMAVNYASVLNGGRILEPRVGDYFGVPPRERTEPEALPSVDPLIETTASPSPTVSASPTPSISPSAPASPTASASPTPAESGPEARTNLEEEKVVERIKTKTVEKLPLDEIELSVLRQGMEDVVMGAEGTAAGAFVGFPLETFPVAGKTGTAQIGETADNRAWFVSYAPADNPQYVVAVYLNYAGHGGESAAPVAREIFEGIFNLDSDTGDVLLGQDASG
jgi:penicillin-binding protein 2